MKDEWKPLVERLEALSRQLERLLPPADSEPDWKAGRAYRWRKGARASYLEPIRHPHTIRFADLKDIDEQKRRLRENTAQFVAGRPANNVLLTGSRGTGKSSLVKAALAEFGPKGAPIEVASATRSTSDIVDIVPTATALMCSARPPFEDRRGTSSRCPRRPTGLGRNVLIYAPRTAASHARVQDGTAGGPGRRDPPGETTEEDSLRSLRPRSVLALRPGAVPRHRRPLGGRAGRQGERGVAQGGVAVGARARLQERPRRVAVRARLGREEMNRHPGRRHRDDGSGPDSR